MMARFLVDPQNVSLGKGLITINDREAHHIIDVMRLKEDSIVDVFDGNGNEYSCKIKSIDRSNKSVLLSIDSKKDKPPGKGKIEISLYQAIPKKNRMDFVIEKATELNVNFICPMITERTVVRPDGPSSNRKRVRWTKIAEESSKQCDRSFTPKVQEIKSFKDIIGGLDDFDIVLVGHLYDNRMALKNIIKDFSISLIIFNSFLLVDLPLTILTLQYVQIRSQPS